MMTVWHGAGAPRCWTCGPPAACEPRCAASTSPPWRCASVPAAAAWQRPARSQPCPGLLPPAASAWCRHAPQTPPAPAVSPAGTRPRRGLDWTISSSAGWQLLHLQHEEMEQGPGHAGVSAQSWPFWPCSRAAAAELRQVAATCHSSIPAQVWPVESGGPRASRSAQAAPWPHAAGRAAILARPRSRQRLVELARPARNTWPSWTLHRKGFRIKLLATGTTSTLQMSKSLARARPALSGSQACLHLQ